MTKPWPRPRDVPHFGLRTRGRTYATLTGIALGITLTGLALPWVVGEPVSTTAAGVASEQPGIDDGGGVPPAGSPGDATVVPTAGATNATATASGGPTARPATESSPSSPQADTGGRGATDVGVTPTTVKIAFLLLDIGSVSRLGVGVPGVDPKQQEEAIRVHLDQINEQGGIGGRTIEPYFRSFDVLSQDDMRAACIAATEDAKAFAVVAAGGYEATPGMCVTREHRTPLVLQCCAHDGNFATSEGRMFTLFAGATRLMHMWVHELHRTNRLQGKTIGVLNDERYDPGETMAKTALIPAMSRYGYTIKHRTRLAEDLNTGASQIPNEVQQMRAKGIDTVFLTSNTIYSSQFVQTADAQGWHPTYFTSDWAGMNTDTTNQNMPDSYDGTVGWTVSRSNEELETGPEPAPAAACRDRYEKATGKTIARDSGEYGITILWCDLFEVALAGLRGAGGDLTRARFSEGVQRTGPIPMSTIGRGGFSPGRFDAAELIRMQQWHADCKCWKPADQFRATPY